MSKEELIKYIQRLNIDTVEKFEIVFYKDYEYDFTSRITYENACD